MKKVMLVFGVRPFGTFKLVGTDENMIFRSFKVLIEDEEEYSKMRKANNPYGDGFACKRIADLLELGD